MNPVNNSNEVFSHDAIKYVYQDADMRMVNPSMLNVKQFKIPDKKEKKEAKKKSKEKDKDDRSSGLFDLF